MTLANRPQSAPSRPSARTRSSRASPQQPASSDDAARFVSLGPNLRAPRSGARVSVGGAHDVLRRRRVLHDEVRDIRVGAAPGGLVLIAVGWRRGIFTPGSSACSSSVDHRDDVGTLSILAARGRSSSGITPKGHLERRRSRSHEGASASFRSPSSPSWFLDVLADVWRTARERAWR